MIPHVTFLYGGLTALLVVVLGANVTRLRAKHGVASAPGPLPAPLHFASRAHGNAAEWAPLAIVLLWLLEVGQVGSVPLHVFGGLLFLGRVLHAAGFLFGPQGLAAVGATLNYLLYATMAVRVLALAL